MLIVSLPNVGTMTRIACGSTTRRMVSVDDMPSESAASVWPASTEMMPARTELGGIGGLVETEREDRRHDDV